ncbi:MAG: thioredoxin domain-containing protein [candidate division WOR-3 bacterium]
MILYLFGNQNCEACKKILEKLKYYKENFNKDIEIIYFDTETPDGMAEACFYDVWDIPQVILMKDGKIIKRWQKTAPTFEELNQLWKS